MVRKKTAFFRLAFTMIELIFAVVILSIAVISLPMMIQITSKGIEENIVQEAIFAASAELMGVTSYYWDLHSMYDSDESHLERVIDIANICESDSSNSRHRLRLGHINQPYHRRCLESSAITPADANSSDFPNLNNAQHGSQSLFTDNTTDGTGYKKNYNSTVTVTRTDDIKKITISITDTDGKTVTSLSTYSTNIGETDHYKRKF